MLTCLTMSVILLMSLPLPELSSAATHGREFITAFIENVAYYFPFPGNNVLLITALHSNTTVKIVVPKQPPIILLLNAGDCHVVPLPITVELLREKVSLKVVKVTSSQDITVFSVSSKASSTETSVVYPVHRLGTNYRVTVNAAALLEPYRLVIVNNNRTNKVFISSHPETVVNLNAYETFQFFATPSEAEMWVVAEQPVAVLLGDGWADTVSCSCSLAFEQLPAEADWGTTFILPRFPFGVPALLLVTSNSTEEKSSVDPSSADSSNEESSPLTASALAAPDVSLVSLLQRPSSDASAYINTPIPVSLMIQFPGLVFGLLPLERFSNSFLVHTLPLFNNFIMLVVDTAHVKGVMFGAAPLPTSVSWETVPGTNYSSAVVGLNAGFTRIVIWHPYSRMGVYMFGTNETTNTSYGSSALSLEAEPDSMVLVKEQKNWAEALQHCRDDGGQLLSVSTQGALEDVKLYLGGAGEDALAWIGMRRSLLGGEWRWLSRATMAMSLWAEGEPADDLQRYCAAMSFKPGANFTWHSLSCCQALHFACYKAGSRFPFLY